MLLVVVLVVGLRIFTYLQFINCAAQFCIVSCLKGEILHYPIICEKSLKIYLIPYICTCHVSLMYCVVYIPVPVPVHRT